MNEQGVRRFLGEANTVVADAKAQLGGVALQLLDIALAGFGEAVESSEDAHRHIAINLPNVGSRGSSKDDLLHARSRQRLESSAEEPNSERMSS